MMAGEPIGNGIKCQLKPLNRNDYQASFTDAEWARLQAVFPNGACDWSKPGADERAPKGTWLSFSAPAGEGKSASPDGGKPSGN